MKRTKRKRIRRLSKKDRQRLVVLLNKNEAKYDLVTSKNDYNADYNEDYAI